MFSRCLHCQRSFANHPNIPRVIYNSAVFKKLPRYLVNTIPENKKRFSTFVTEKDANKQTKSDSGEPNNEEAQKRRARLVSVMIGSAVGFLGSSYVLYNQLTKNKAKAEGATHIEKENAEENKNEEDKGQDVVEEEKKKKKKGFRARRVRILQILFRIFIRTGSTKFFSSLTCNMQCIVVLFG